MTLKELMNKLNEYIKEKPEVKNYKILVDDIEINKNCKIQFNTYYKFCNIVNNE